MKIILLMRSKVFTGRELRTCVVAAQHKIFDGKLCKVRIKSAIEKLHQSHSLLSQLHIRAEKSFSINFHAWKYSEYSTRRLQHPSLNMSGSKIKEPTIKFNPTPTTKSLLKKEKSVEGMKRKPSLSFLSSSSLSSSSKKKNKVGNDNNAAATEEMPTKAVSKRRSRLFTSLERSPSDPTTRKKATNKLQKRKSAVLIDDLFAKHTST